MIFFYLRLLMTLKLIAGPHDVLPRSFQPWSAELLFNTDPLQLDKLTSALPLTGGVLKTQHCSSSPHGPVRFVSSIKHYSPPFYSSRPSHNSSYSWSPKKDAEMPKNGAHILFLCFVDFS